jgi:DNA helicase HerA-like ATPase
VAVAEETADVTNPGKAPPGWGELVRRGRKREITLYAITQRPAESDKTAFTNASMLHVGNLNRYQDRVYISRELDCAETEIAALKPLDWIERDRRTGVLRKGRLSF